jgi:hypothetical protein
MSIKKVFNFYKKMLTDMSFDIQYLSKESYSTEMLPLY